MRRLVFILAFILGLLSISIRAHAQEAAGAVAQDDSTSARKKKEIVLDEILIEAILEKPNVAILPSRPALKLDKMAFVTRTFDSELRAAPSKTWFFDADFDKVHRAEQVKKLLANETN
ncbi:MAG: hypothetical protein D6743_06950 [Calditrichaeota bacterium]|nr:MAG: hypothetical protein D6743_06950 [Calditrichota bacterium]